MIKKSLVCFLSVIIIGGMVFTAIPSYAYTVNGVELVEITLTYQDYMDMFAEGGFTVFYRLSSPTSVDISLFDMYQNATSQVVTITSTPTVYQLTEMILNGSSNLVFASRYAYNMRVNSNASLIEEVVYDLPFPYYIDGATIGMIHFSSGTSTTDCDFKLYLKNNDETVVYKTTTSTPQIRFWTESSVISSWVNAHNISTFPSGYTFDTDSSTGIRTRSTLNTRFYNVTNNSPIDQILIGTQVGMTHTSGTGYTYSFICPMIASISLPLTVYVEPDIADTVEEYLDLIVNPSPEDEERIEELKDKFSSTVDDLEAASDNLHKDMPDLPDVTDLDEDVTEGMEEATENVMNNMLGIGVVNTILGATFIFAVIKILLYGSGPY